MKSRTSFSDLAIGITVALALLMTGCERSETANQGNASSRPAVGDGSQGAGTRTPTADALLSAGKERKAESVPELLRAMKDRSHSAFILTPDASAPFGLRVEDNPFGGEDTRSLQRIA